MRQLTGYKVKIVFDNQSKTVVLGALLSVILLNISGKTRAVEPSKFGWVGMARVFLIDTYQPPFAPKLEFDAEALVETMADMHINTVRMAMMGKYATIQAVRFPTHPDQGDRDLLAEMIAACKPRKIRVVPYISTGRSWHGPPLQNTILKMHIVLHPMEYPFETGQIVTSSYCSFLMIARAFVS